MMVIKEKLQAVTVKVVTAYDPEKIILFGSHAWGEVNEDSDVDLLIIKETKNPFETARQIDGSIFPRPFPLDIVVYTPQQISQREEAGDIFIKDILTNGKILYEKPTSRMV